MGDVLVLAGDIVPFGDIENANAFFDYVSDHYSAVYWVPGNHEYYGSDLAVKPGSLQENIRKNVYLVNNQAIEQNGIRFVFSTLWSWIGPLFEFEIQRCLPDFSAITDGEAMFTVRRFNSLHANSRAFLRKTLSSVVDKPTVIVTHHVPTLLNYPSIYRKSFVNEAFAVELYDFIEASGAAYWIYGHHHFNNAEFQIGRTTMLTNQLGYVRHRKYSSFRGDGTVDLSPVIMQTLKDRV